MKGSESAMRKRGLRIDVMLNEIEYKKLMDDVEREKTSYSDYVRKLIMKAELKEKPDYEFYNVMKELTKIGINLNQLAKKANTLNFIDKDEYKKQADDWKNFSDKIKNKYL